MKQALRNAAFWLPAWIGTGMLVGLARGWCPATVHWTECVIGSMSYVGLEFIAGYWLTRTQTRHPALMAMGGMLGVGAFYACTSIGR